MTTREDRADEPAEPHDDLTRLAGYRWILVAFENVEHVVFAALGVILSLTAVFALVDAVMVLWGGLHALDSNEVTLDITERMLFVVMLVEILYTVRVSMRTGGLTTEPFLIIGLIASIRRVLLITLQSSQAAHAKEWTDDVAQQFHASMIELAVLALLILTMVVSLYLLRRMRPQ